MSRMPDAARKVLVEGVFPHCSDHALEFALDSIKNYGKRWLQGATTSPPPLQCVIDHLVEGACLLGLCGWGEVGDDATVGQVEERFAQMCHAADLTVGEPASVRWFLNWHDETPTAEVRATLIQELDAELQRRHNPG